jgi:hypothetical protein
MKTSSVPIRPGWTEAAKTVYRLRKQTIELVFADFKEHRGLRRFSGHGLARVRTELALEVLVHNLLRLENVEHTFAPVEAPSHARRWAPVVRELPSWTVNKGA